MRVSNRKNYSAGSKRDSCGSPPYAIVPLVDLLDKYNLYYNGTDDRSKLLLWEPAVGPDEEHFGLVNGLMAVGFRVVYTSDDFLAYDELPYTNINGIITNPPFSSHTKQKFVRKCEYFREKNGIFWSLLVNPMTMWEVKIMDITRNCSIHIPLGRISFNMPEKGWGTESNPTTPTFNTTWISRSLCPDDPTRTYSDFKMTPNHYAALPRWLEYLEEIWRKMLNDYNNGS